MTLSGDVALYFQAATATELSQATFSYHNTFDKDHGRIEKRSYWSTDDLD